MSEIAEQNVEIFRQRWPALAAKVLATDPPEDTKWEGREEAPTLSVNGLRLWSAYDPIAEARIQASLIPEGSREASVYGVGGGDLIRELLKRKEIQRVRVIPLNFGLLNLLLHLLDHRDWLNHPKVEVIDPNLQINPKPPFAVIPPYLSFFEENLAALRDRLVQALEAPFQNEIFDRKEPKRRKQVDENAELVKTDGDVAELFDTAPGCTAFVVAAGPTLKTTVSWLKTHRSEGKLIAVDGALRPLLDHDLIPDVVVSVDDNRNTVLPYFEIDLDRYRQVPLVYAPVVHHDIITLWPGRRLATYTRESVYNDLRDEHPRAELFAAGSVLHRAVDLAVKIGAAQIVLFGADFGFPEGKIHANENGPIGFYANAAKGGANAMNGHGQAIPSLNSFNSYRTALENYISHHPHIQFLNSSRLGAQISGTLYY